MTAKEMFKELGFESRKNDGTKLVYRNFFDDIVIFNLKSKGHSFKLSGFGTMKITIDLHKAIHQQMIELGWLE